MRKSEIYDTMPAIAVAMQYYENHKHDKQPTKNMLKVSEALECINIIFQGAIDEDEKDICDVRLTYGMFDARITVTLPTYWCVSKEMMQWYKKLVLLSGEIDHRPPMMGENCEAIADIIVFYILDVFKI